MASTTDQDSCWLMKAEPETRLEKGKDVAFSIAHLASSPNQSTIWDGVRNHQAKNHMISMRRNQRVLFYHSNCKIPGIAGLARISSEQSFPDPSAFDPDHPYFDPRSKKENPTWFCVEVRYERVFEKLVPLELLKMIGNDGMDGEQRVELDKVLSKEMIEGISQMTLIKTSRLSVQPVPTAAYDAIVALASNASVWSKWPGKWNQTAKSKQTKKASGTASTSKATKATSIDDEKEEGTRKSGRTKKRKADEEEDVEAEEKAAKKKKGKGKK